MPAWSPSQLFTLSGGGPGLQAAAQLPLLSRLSRFLPLSALDSVNRIRSSLSATNSAVSHLDDTAKAVEAAIGSVTIPMSRREMLQRSMKGLQAVRSKRVTKRAANWLSAAADMPLSGTLTMPAWNAYWAPEGYKEEGAMRGLALGAAADAGEAIGYALSAPLARLAEAKILRRRIGAAEAAKYLKLPDKLERAFIPRGSRDNFFAKALRVFQPDDELVRSAYPFLKDRDIAGWARIGITHGIGRPIGSTLGYATGLQAVGTPSWAKSPKVELDAAPAAEASPAAEVPGSEPSVPIKAPLSQLLRKLPYGAFAAGAAGTAGLSALVYALSKRHKKTRDDEPKAKEEAMNKAATAANRLFEKVATGAPDVLAARLRVAQACLLHGATPKQAFAAAFDDLAPTGRLKVARWVVKRAAGWGWEEAATQGERFANKAKERIGKARTWTDLSGTAADMLDDAIGGIKAVRQGPPDWYKKLSRLPGGEAIARLLHRHPRAALGTATAGLGLGALGAVGAYGSGGKEASLFPALAKTIRQSPLPPLLKAGPVGVLGDAARFAARPKSPAIDLLQPTGVVDALKLSAGRRAALMRALESMRLS